MNMVRLFMIVFGLAFTKAGIIRSLPVSDLMRLIGERGGGHLKAEHSALLLRIIEAISEV
jgi:hypothetical protein